MLTEIDTIDTPAVTLSNFRIADEDLPPFRDMKFENINQLHLDHPGANDPAYRERRNYIASLAKKFRDDAEAIRLDHPFTARCLLELAADYDHQGRWHDTDEAVRKRLGRP